jgi:hypothetical protein
MLYFKENEKKKNHIKKSNFINKFFNKLNINLPLIKL